MKLVALGLLSALVVSAPTPTPATDLDKVAADDVGLYRRETLPEWKKLFLPHFTVASTREDGTAGERTLEEFSRPSGAISRAAATSAKSSKNVRIERNGKLASVWVDFVLTDRPEDAAAKLVLLLIEGLEGFRIPLTDAFFYDG